MSSRIRALPRQLFPLYAGTIATRIGTFVVPYLTLYLSTQRGLALSTTGTVIAAGGVGLLVGNVVGGWLADRIGRRPTLLLALAVNVAGIAALAMALPSSAAYALALAFALAGGGMYTPAANAWIADLTSEAERPLAYTVNYICINVGMGLGPLLGGVLAATSFAWLFVGDVVTTLVCAGFIAAASTGSGRKSSASPIASRQLERTRLRRELEVWTSPAALRVLVFCGAAFFVIAPLMGLEYAVPLFVGVVLQEPVVLVGVIYSVNAACILALGLRVERVVKGRDPHFMMIVAGCLWTLGLSILVFGFSSLALIASTVVWTLGEIVGSVVLPTYVASHAPSSARGRFLAVPDAVRSVAGIVAPISLGLVWEVYDVDVVLALLLATPVLGVLLFAVGWMRRGRAALASESA